MYTRHMLVAVKRAARAHGKFRLQNGRFRSGLAPARWAMSSLSGSLTEGTHKQTSRFLLTQTASTLPSTILNNSPSLFLTKYFIITSPPTFVSRGCRVANRGRTLYFLSSPSRSSLCSLSAVFVHCCCTSLRPVPWQCSRYELPLDESGGSAAAPALPCAAPFPLLHQYGFLCLQA